MIGSKNDMGVISSLLSGLLDADSDVKVILISSICYVPIQIFNPLYQLIYLFIYLRYLPQVECICSLVKLNATESVVVEALLPLLKDIDPRVQITVLKAISLLNIKDDTTTANVALTLTGILFDIYHFCIGFPLIISLSFLISYFIIIR